MRVFLHWGYNFYNAQYSKEPINPYCVTDALGAFPSGDPYVVYPSKEGTAYESLRLMVFSQALYDLRALEKLEELTSREYVETLIHENLDYRITFDQYPPDSRYLYGLRDRVDAAIELHM